MISILHEDEHLIAVHKPCGLLVHRTRISEDTVFALQLLRRQLGYRVYPAHRLDRATSGLLLFGKSREAAARLGELFRERRVQKQYEAVIRGYVEKDGEIDYPLKHERSGAPQESRTRYRRLAQVEQSFAVSRYPTSRYSRVLIEPLTGRRHQIRRHFAHLRHPIIGDRRHGDCKHNKFFRKELGITRMLLHAKSLQFIHPFSEKEITLEAPLDETFRQALTRLALL